MTGIIPQEVLEQMAGVKQKSRLKRYLVEHGIDFREGTDGRIWTTLAQVDRIFDRDERVEFE